MKQLILSMLLLFTTQVMAEVKIVVPFAPGGPADRTTRTLQEMLSQELQQPIAVEYKPGGGGSIGIAAVATADPKETVLLITGGAPIVNSLIKEPIKSDQLIPLVNLGNTPMVLTTSNKFGIKTIDEWRKLSSTQPINIATVGPGSVTHIIGQSFNQRLPKNVTLVPYKGQAPMVTDLIAGHVDAGFIAVGMAADQVKANKINAVAVNANARVSELPDVPTFKELGLGELTSFSWLAVFSNRTNNVDTLKRVQRALTTILQDPARLEKFQQMGIETSTREVALPANFLEREKTKMVKFNRLVGE